MGAEEFCVTGHGESADEVFERLREDAFYEYGHGGYTGTIAEKTEFVLVENPFDLTVEVILRMLDSIDAKIAVQAMLPGVSRRKFDAWLDKVANLAFDKWGPAVAIETGIDTFTFFGWASS